MNELRDALHNKNNEMERIKSILAYRMIGITIQKKAEKNPELVIDLLGRKDPYVQHFAARLLRYNWALKQDPIVLALLRHLPEKNPWNERPGGAPGGPQEQYQRDRLILDIAQILSIWRVEEALPYIRNLTTKPWEKISTELIEKCAEVGVAVALVPSVAKTGLRGAAYWAKKDKAVIVLSDRMKHEENIWFSFFHEACHILEHSKKSVFIDQDDKGTGNNDIESDADQFSAETLIPMSTVRDFQLEYGRKVTRISSADFKKFANKHSISPGLLLVRLQHHDVIPRKTQLAKLRRKVEFTMHS